MEKDHGGPETHAGQVFGAGEGEQETGGAGTRGPEGDHQTEGGTAGQQGQGGGLCIYSHFGVVG